MTIPLGLALAAACAWIWLLLFNGRFWLADQSLDAGDGEEGDALSGPWPEIVAVIPARNEAEVIGKSIEAHGRIAYSGAYTAVLVDDGSEDGTAEIAAAAATRSGLALHIEKAPPLEPGWSGKLWALDHGIAAARTHAPNAEYILLMDADIVPAPKILDALAAKAQREDLSLVSLMALLDARGIWAGFLIPAFVYFFQKLYPFPRVNDPTSRVAGAAGGCVLLRRTDLEAAGGIAAIGSALIDDCTLAGLIKGRPPQRAIWLGLTKSVVSLRDNRALGDIWAMVARTAYTQLGYSPVLLAGTLAGLALVYLAAPLLALTMPWHGHVAAGLLGAATWIAMALTFVPTLRLYGKSVAAGLLLPLAGLLYAGMTFSSAWRHWRGAGGRWKGRTYSAAAGASGGMLPNRRK